jgi:hypothetical protein
MTGKQETVAIRIWDGCVVRHVIIVGPTGSTSLGAVGAAHHSTKVDIELDPWAGLVVDNRAENSFPMLLRDTVADDEG